MALDQKDILQVNVTVIAGALVFPTLIATVGSNTSEVLNNIVATNTSIGTIVGFSVSLLFAITPVKEEMFLLLFMI